MIARGFACGNDSTTGPKTQHSSTKSIHLPRKFDERSMLLLTKALLLPSITLHPPSAPPLPSSPGTAPDVMVGVSSRRESRKGRGAGGEKEGGEAREERLPEVREDQRRDESEGREREEGEEDGGGKRCVPCKAVACRGVPHEEAEDRQGEGGHGRCNCLLAILPGLTRLAEGPREDPIRSAVECRCVLGESPVWDGDANVLYFVDINGRRVHSHNPSDGAAKTWELDGEVGCVVPGPDRRRVYAAVVDSIFEASSRSRSDGQVGDPLLQVDVEKEGAEAVRKVAALPDG
eukprot:757718-Hanusia_phi.AAC.2